jgi:hypothetical protein
LDASTAARLGSPDSGHSQSATEAPFRLPYPIAVVTQKIDPAAGDAERPQIDRLQPAAIGEVQLSICGHCGTRPRKCCYVYRESIAMGDFHAGVEDEFQRLIDEMITDDFQKHLEIGY